MKDSFVCPCRPLAASQKEHNPNLASTSSCSHIIGFATTCLCIERHGGQCAVSSLCEPGCSLHVAEQQARDPRHSCCRGSQTPCCHWSVRAHGTASAFLKWSRPDGVRQWQGTAHQPACPGPGCGCSGRWKRGWQPRCWHGWTDDWARSGLFVDREHCHQSHCCPCCCCCSAPTMGNCHSAEQQT